MIQTSCLVNDGNGHRYMEHYDQLPFDARRRLQNSKYNLCSYCVMKCAHELGNPHTAITYMEGMIAGHDMRSYFEEAVHKAKYQPDWHSIQYTPKYWDDRDIGLKVKRDWYTQRIERYDSSYLIMPKIIKPTDYF